MLTKDIGKRMLKNLLEIILDISDKEYQKRVWIRGEGPEIDDFTETVCKFFDNGDSLLNEYKKCGITKNQHQILKKFSNKFRVFSDEHSYELEFIDTPEWNEITENAKEVLKAFNYRK
jgi:hypothetical protein